MDWLDRQRRLIGTEATKRLTKARVAVVGLGGVGGGAVEALARCGIGALLVMDRDVFDVTNLNRQLLATDKTIGKSKAETAKERILSINPNCTVTVLDKELCEKTASELFDFSPDFVIDAIDMVSAKLLLIEECRARAIRLITCLGTGNRTDAGAFRTGDISETSGTGDALARVMRHELRKREIADVAVLYSTAEAQKPLGEDARTPSSISFVPPVAGFLLAQYVVGELIK
ncbi:MAG: tRNA threonylcarbamoyladenosine dehydratase [Oscillospiraceae bacterium]